MAQIPIKKAAIKAAGDGLAGSNAVDAQDNTWITGSVSITGVAAGISLPVTVSGTFPVTLSGTGAFNLLQVGGTAVTLGQALSVASLPVVIARDQAPLPVAPPSIATAPLSSTSAAYETSRVAKSTAGVCFGIAGYNSKGSTQFILVLDATALPVNGAIPVDVISVAAASNFSIDFGYWGRRFNAGIVVANSSTGPTLTIGSADVWYDVRYV